MSKPLFDASDESDVDNNLELGTNQEYAKSYNILRKKELLKKLKDRGYNNISDANSSEDSESSDDDEGNLDEEFDRQFFKTLASLKSKDPAIYDKNTRFFSINSDDNETEEDKNKAIKKEKKPVTLKDYERKVIVEHGGRFEDDSDDQSEKEAVQRPASPTVVEEERRLKAEFKEVLEADDSADEEFGGIFKRRVKSKEESQKEETDFAEWLAGKKADIEGNAKQKLEPLKNYWNQKNLPQSERFLRDYILSKGYNNTKSSDIPTYEEIVGDDDDIDGPKAFSDDERELEKQAEFEEKYNFRFEEPDTEFIKRFPRTIENSVRQDAGKRKEKRQEIKQRKLAEKEQKIKELEILKEMKRKEIEEKIEKLKKVTGNEELGFKDDELEEDFDPEAHDRRMREIFNDDYYQIDEGEEKPECPSDIDELKIEDWDNYDPERAQQFNNDDYDNEPHCEDDDFNMDCDYDPVAAKQQFQQELIDNTKKRKNRRGRRNRFMEMIQKDKPAFNPEDEKTYGEYIDEYYKMDCEDIIDDIPCRFKYTETTPNDFGLTIEEILLAKNKELNQWASLKKTLQIRPEQVEKRDQRLYKLKAKNEQLKRKIFKSLYGENSDDENDSGQEVENEIKTEIAKKATSNQTEQASKNKAQLDQSNEPAAKKSKLDDKNESTTSNDLKSETVTVAIDKKKKKKKKKKSQNQNSQNPQTNSTNAQNHNLSNGEIVTINQVKDNKPIISPKSKTNPFKAPQNNDTQNSVPPADKKKRNKYKKDQNPQTNQVSESSSKNLDIKSDSPKIQTSESKIKLSNPSEDIKTLDSKSKENPFKMNRKDNAPKFENEKANGNPKFNREFKKQSNINSKSKPKFKAFNKRKNATNGGVGGSRGSNSNKFQINDERLKAYNINPRKFHKKQKFGKNNSN